MYHPYFRGKQFELITIRETADTLASSEFVPIVEPVKESLGGLQRTVQAVCDAGGSAIIVVNPYHGDHAEDGVEISGLLHAAFAECDNIAAGILLKKDMTVAEAMACFNQHAEHERAIVPTGASIDYVPSQYLCEFVKKCGYAGVLYRSSVSNGVNLALFDPELATPGTVRQYDIERVSVLVRAI